MATVSAPSAPAVLATGSTPAARGALGDSPPRAPGGAAPTGPAAHPAGTTAPPSAATSTASTGHASTAPSTGPAPPAGAVELAEHEPILAIGDSVLLAASPVLDTVFGSRITIDAAVGRQPQTGLDRLAAYRDSGQLARYRTLVVDLGTNGLFSGRQFQTLEQLSAGVPLVVVYTVYAQRSWISGSNSAIRSGVAGDHDMRLADWDAAVSPSLLYPDGVHPNPTGAKVYAHLLEEDLCTPAQS